MFVDVEDPYLYMAVDGSIGLYYKALGANMTIIEVLLCLSGFLLTSLVVYVYSKDRFGRFGKIMLFLPGFIVATIISRMVSKPGDGLFSSTADYLTDQPIFVGFPLSFYEIGAFGATYISWPKLLLNLAIVIILGLTVVMAHRSR